MKIQKFVDEEGYQQTLGRLLLSLEQLGYSLQESNPYAAAKCRQACYRLGGVSQDLAVIDEALRRKELYDAPSTNR